MNLVPLFGQKSEHFVRKKDQGTCFGLCNTILRLPKILKNFWEPAAPRSPHWRTPTQNSQESNPLWVGVISISDLRQVEYSNLVQPETRKIQPPAGWSPGLELTPTRRFRGGWISNPESHNPTRPGLEWTPHICTEDLTVCDQTDDRSDLSADRSVWTSLNSYELYYTAPYNAYTMSNNICINDFAVCEFATMNNPDRSEIAH